MATDNLDGSERRCRTRSREGRRLRTAVNARAVTFSSDGNPTMRTFSTTLERRCLFSLPSAQFDFAKEQLMRRVFTGRVALIVTLGIICMAASGTALKADDAPLVDSTVRAPPPQFAQLDSRLEKLEAALEKHQHTAPDEPFLKNITHDPSGIASLLAVLVAIAALIWQRQTWNVERELNRKLKATEVASWCIDRFYEIEEDYEKSDAMYYNRLWGLHYAQFYHYKNRLLDPKLYATWLDYLRIAYKDHDVADKLQWGRVRDKHFNDPKFVGFIDGILKCKDSDAVGAFLAKEQA
jgi:hypothetical protein